MTTKTLNSEQRLRQELEAVCMPGVRLGRTRYLGHRHGHGYDSWSFIEAFFEGDERCEEQRTLQELAFDKVCHPVAGACSYKTVRSHDDMARFLRSGGYLVIPYKSSLVSGNRRYNTAKWSGVGPFYEE
jgi:hypothetical protein